MVGVRNIGQANAPASVLRAFWDDGAPPTDVATPALAPGETLHVLATRPATTEGTHELRLEADATGLVAEWDETDNGLVHTFTVLPPQPDLVVMDLWAQPSNETAGTQTLVATIANVGSATASASTVRFVVHGEVHDEQVPEMPRDTTVEVTLTVSSNADGYNVTVTADFGQEVVELDEENNNLSTFIWAYGYNWAAP